MAYVEAFAHKQNEALENLARIKRESILKPAFSDVRFLWHKGAKETQFRRSAKMR